MVVAVVDALRFTILNRFEVHVEAPQPVHVLQHLFGVVLLERNASVLVVPKRNLAIATQ